MCHLQTSIHISESSLVASCLSSISDVLKIFTDYEGLKEMYLCGGGIRDFILNKKIGKDIDIFINCSKEELQQLVTYLKAFGTVYYGQYGSPRFYPAILKESYVDIVPFYNFIVPAKPVKTIDELLHNFDFTANALAIDIRSKSFFNPVGGLEDIQRKMLKAVRLDFPERQVSAIVPMSAVSVFWFRLLHYQNKLGFSFEHKTEEWIIENQWRKRDLGKFEKYFFVPSFSREMKAKLSL